MLCKSICENSGFDMVLDGKWGFWGLTPRKNFQRDALQNGRKCPFAEEDVAVSIIDFHTKMEKLAPLRSCFIRTSKLEVQAGCSHFF